ncbi:hypothetical protein TELCIR_12768 [Teladorsagia circumcincta]|uniref:7TM GPCR serpentine receptor class x (Srx) domain-containing protein n=1 Tax=Teladorsagia circumcincta TaxID=45464 RepID=A0A2G9U5W3_TELCI|nr:hypothetical protein TELCIR_12768 [Teladorsagia circumcincta]
MNNTNMDLEEQTTVIAFPGTICNVLVALFTRKVKTLNNPFGRLTASQAAGEAILCALFTFYYVPMVALDITAMKDFSHYVGFTLLICYDICIFSHLIIAFNRMSAIFFPLSYSTHFRDLLVIILGSRLHLCEKLANVNFIQDVSIVILIAIIDVVTIIKYRLSAEEAAKSTCQKKRNADKNLLRQFPYRNPTRHFMCGGRTSSDPGTNIDDDVVQKIGVDQGVICDRARNMDIKYRYDVSTP